MCVLPPPTAAQLASLTNNHIYAVIPFDFRNESGDTVLVVGVYRSGTSYYVSYIEQGGGSFMLSSRLLGSASDLASTLEAAGTLLINNLSTNPY